MKILPLLTGLLLTTTSAFATPRTTIVGGQEYSVDNQVRVGNTWVTSLVTPQESPDYDLVVIPGLGDSQDEVIHVSCGNDQFSTRFGETSYNPIGWTAGLVHSYCNGIGYDYQYNP